MIQATECRIGNWVEEVFAGGRGQKQVNWLMLQDMCKKVPMFLYEPIPLSPDILEKCGFVEAYKSAYSHRFELEKYPAFEYMMNSNGHIGGVRYFGQVTGKVIYLHQLQNLYFALTGEELTLNL